MMGDDGRSPQQVRRLSPNRNKERRSRGGPKSLCLQRSDNGFGFTLRHFVVYPPESCTVLSGDRRYGLRGAPADGPMDTIFVKSVRSGSGAELAGLCKGDQLVSVNGEPITGRSYAQVVHLIQASPTYLHLLVVPKEEDLLQLYYGDTAHNPKTNPRPLSRSRGSPHHSPAASSSPARRVDNSPLHFPVKMPVETDYTGSSESMPGGGYSLPPNLAGCRLSLDGGSSRRDSQDTIHSSDDSIIMSRIRKSLEQKEEFLRGVISTSPTPVREYYSRPQKLQPPVWPPAIPASAVNPPPPKEIIGNGQPLSPRGFIYGGPVTNVPMIDNSGRYTARLGKIQEGSSRHSSPPARQSPSRQTSPPVRQESPLGNVQPLRIVSERARQFETGSCLADRTDLYRSELARLNNKRNVPNVAVRRKEFENRASDWRQHSRESRSLDSNSGSLSPTPTNSGNRVIPVGSSKLHCDPPNDFNDTEPSERKTRPRSNSVESWNDRKTQRTARSSDPPLRHKAVRQDSYLAAVKKPVNSQANGDKETETEINGDLTTMALTNPKIQVDPPAIKKRPQRPTRLELPTLNQTSTPPQIGVSSSPGSTPDSENREQPSIDNVVKRQKPQSDEVSEEDRVARRVSYLKATWADRGHLDSDLELSDGDIILSHKRSLRKWRPPLFPDDIQKIVKLFEPLPTIYDPCIVAVPPRDQEIIIEGQLYCKSIQVDGKKATDRSWRSVYASVRASILFLFKDKKDANSEVLTMRGGKMYVCQDPVFVSCLPIFASGPRPQLRRWGSVGSWTPVDHERLDLTNSIVTAAEDYTKKRHVIRLATPSSSELLLQTDNAEDMSRWLTGLAPQNQDSIQHISTGSLQNISPVSAHKSLMKNITTTFRNRSPTGQSPVNKTRKPSQGEVPAAAVAKSKTWKNRMAKQLKKIQTGGGSPVSPTAPAAYQEGASIGVPLELCPRSKANEFVPLLVESCTKIVEERGLETIGIYRVPGNTAAITSLTEAVNKGLKDLIDNDQRWSEVHVISSLLKLFFRRLPDCLLTTELYPNFIQADKIEDPKRRMIAIRNLVQELPDHHHHTLKHLMMHLKLIVEHSNVNKMEARNLAIVFGPTLVRANDDNMVTMVTDMSHQCRIVETLILHAEWCFGEDSPDTLRFQDTHDANGQTESESAIPNQSLLLGNVHKLEGMKGISEVSKRAIVTSIITAANKKITKTKLRKQVNHEDLQMERGDKRKERKSSGDAVDSEAKSIASAIASGVRGSVLFSESTILSSPQPDSKELQEKITEVQPAKPPTSDGTIVTYTGLSETTQERIRRFEMETKAMLQRDKVLNNKDWLKPTAPPAIGNRIAEGGQEVNKQQTGGLSPLAKWKQITSPPQVKDSDTPSKLVKCGSLDSLSSETFDNQKTVANDGIVNAGGVDLVSSLTLTFDAKMKSLGLISPTDDIKEEREEGEDEKSYRDPSLHRSFTSPNLEFKVLELPTGESLKEEEKFEVEKDDEKENCAVGKLKRSESFKQREKKEEMKHLRRSESLNKKDSGMNKLKRSDSLTKNEKTDLNLSKKKQSQEATKKMKRKTGGDGTEKSIKRRHTVGGTKDFDKAAWLDNKEREANEERRTSSPDLTGDLSRPVLVLRPHSLLVDSPLESHI